MHPASCAVLATCVAPGLPGWEGVSAAQPRSRESLAQPRRPAGGSTAVPPRLPFRVMFSASWCRRRERQAVCCGKRLLRVLAAPCGRGWTPPGSRLPYRAGTLFLT